jgi:multisubunit Na+/H+ antiporter MnhB subunit
MIVQFFIEISIWILIFFILKKNWHNEKVRKHFIDFIIAINVFACILYLYISYFGMFTIQDAVAKIFLHGIVAIIIYTLTKNSFYEK